MAPVAGSRRRRLLLAVGLLFTADGARALQEPRGLIIEEVVPDSNAARSGLRRGDRLLSHDGTSLVSPAGLQAVEENVLAKNAIEWRVQRAGAMLTLSTPSGKLGIQVRPVLSSTILRLYEDGRTAYDAQRTEVAIVRWTTASRAARSAGDLSAAAWLITRVGEIRESQGRWKEAAEGYAAARGLSDSTRDPAAVSRLLAASARCSMRLNDFPGARRLYQDAARLDAGAGYEMWTAADWHSFGTVAYSQGNLDEAERYCRDALDVRERLARDSLEVADSHHTLGNIALSRGNLPLAEDHYNRALRIREERAPDSLDVAKTLNNLGVLAWERNDLVGSEAHHRRALGIRERSAPDTVDLSGTLVNLGNIGFTRGDLRTAQTYYRRALTIDERVAPDSVEVATDLNNLGEVAWSRGDVASAHDFHARSLAIRQRLAPESLEVANSLANLGAVFRARGDATAALAHLERALAIQERIAPDSPSVGHSHQKLGEVAYVGGDIPRAYDHFSRALAIRQRLGQDSMDAAESLDDLGRVLRARGDLAAAADSVNRAYRIRERLGPQSLHLAGSLQHLGDMAVAEARFSEALPLFERAVSIVEGQRWEVSSTDGRSLMLAQNSAAYAGLLRTHLALGDVASAFATAERARARSLLDLLSEARTEIRQGVDPALLERLRSLQHGLNATANRQARLSTERNKEQEAAINAELDAVLIRFREVQAQIRVASPRYDALTEPRPLGAREIQQQVLDKETMLLEYALGEEVSHLFAVTTASVQAFTLPARAVIEQAARRMYELLSARQPVPGESPGQRKARIAAADTRFPEAAAALSAIVLGPVADGLVYERLLIVADGALQYIPFAALPDPRAGKSGSSGAAGQPLVLNHEIISLPSASVLAVLRREHEGRRQAGKLVAVLADPVFDADDARLRKAGLDRGRRPDRSALPADLQRTAATTRLVDERGTLSRLPFTREEADAIVALAPANQRLRAADFDASRATATSPELSGYRIVHLATHGFLNAERPELSGLVLSLVDERGAARDGWLRLHDIYNLNWSADLVVLSACQTALGKEIHGEGLVGLTRGFMYAGAQRVLASLWNVNDSGTARLMAEFYQGLLARGLRPAAALRAAQVEMMKRPQWRAPFYWAGFVLQGEWR